jgi:hypothetical protein
MMQAVDPAARPPLREALPVSAGIGAVACLISGQSWIYEHVERPGARALCEGTCGMDPDATGVLFALPLAALACLVLAVLVGVWRMRSASPGRALRLSLYVAVVVAATSSVVVLQRTDGLRGADVIDVCDAYPGQPAPQDPARCAPRHEPASGAWLLAAGALFAIGAAAAAGPTRPAARVSGKPAVES